MEPFVTNTLYMLALINPVSKIFILSMLPEETKPAEINRICVQSSAIGLAILIALAAAGNFLLRSIFHVDLYSLRIAGGLILLLIGINALTKGVFFEVPSKEQLCEVAVVPLASPLIAGPATITAAISFSAESGVPATCLSLTAAVLVNLILMLAGRHIGRMLSARHVMGPLIRITGLVVATIAVQMMLSGLAGWYGRLR